MTKLEDHLATRTVVACGSVTDGTERVFDPQVLAAARLAGARDLADVLREWLGDRVHLGPRSLDALRVMLDEVRSPGAVAPHVGARRG